MLLARGIFPKFWSIPSLISPSAPTITGTVSVLIPPILVVLISRPLYFESFLMTFVEVFWSDVYMFATPFGMVLVSLSANVLTRIVDPGPNPSFLVWNLKVIDSSHSYSWANLRFLSAPPPPPPPPPHHEVHSPNTRKYFIVHSGYQTAWVHDFLSGKNGNFHLIFSQLQLRISS